MPDVFQVLKKDHDEVKDILAELEEGPRASSGATAEQLAFRKQSGKKLAPTRPHPHVPPQPGAVKAAGPLAGVADKLRDLATGRGRTES